MPKPSKTIATEALRHGEAAQAGTCEAESIVNRLRRRRWPDGLGFAEGAAKAPLTGVLFIRQTR